MIYRASGLPAGRCYFDLQVRFGFIQPFCREAGDRATAAKFELLGERHKERAAKLAALLPPAAAPLPDGR